jgi:serine/threonine-protein kinase
MPDLLERLKSALGDRYAVESEIGRGGMAVVFLAEDLRHDRQVAIKVLHPELTATLGGERFLKEIKTVAGLQHPHILPLYDSGEADGLLYYVMPYAEGESLRQRLDREGQLAVDESVRLAVEVADGLDYAHRKGVVHRDIKPGNILLAEGHATIADFGIARAIEVAKAERVTSTGLGVGTPLYASPEQATAQETLDGRTDIYSLGCVLYEMLAGEPPLAGTTPKMIQARRLSETPTAIHALRDTIPPALDKVIARALARVPADRYATASQFGQALQAVLLTATPAAHADATHTPGTLAARQSGSRRTRYVGLVVALGALLLAIVVLSVTDGWPGRAPLEVTTSNIRAVTSDPGREFQPAISPDGSEVAYVAAGIVVRSTIDIGTGGGSRPAENVPGRHLFPSWTSDGSALRFAACPFGAAPDMPGCPWKEVGSRGGTARTIDLPGESTGYAWSPDGTRVAFAGDDSEDNSIYVHTVGEEAPRAIVERFGAWPIHSLAWSPDGRWIAFVHGNILWRMGTNVMGVAIWMVDADGGQPVQLTDEEHLNVSPQWLPDSRHLMFVSDRDGARGIYVLEVGSEGPRGSPRSIPSSSDPHTISVSSDGRKLAYSNLVEKQNIWSLPIPTSGTVSITDAVQITSGNRLIESHSLSPDGEWIAFDGSGRDDMDIYKQRLAGGTAQLLVDVIGDAMSPEWSPDGTELLFEGPTEAADDNNDLFVVSADGGSLRRLTDYSDYDGRPAWSPDGLAIAYNRPGSERGTWRTWTVSRDAVDMPWGEPVQLTDFGCLSPSWAPDGASLVCNGDDPDAEPEARWAPMRISRNGEVIWRHSPTPVAFRIQWSSSPRFSTDGSRIYFVATDEEGRGVWWIPAEGGQAARIVTFDDPPLSVWPNLTVGPENFYFTIAEYESDIWVMDLDW